MFMDKMNESGSALLLLRAVWCAIFIVFSFSSFSVDAHNRVCMYTFNVSRSLFIVVVVCFGVAFCRSFVEPFNQKCRLPNVMRSW